MKRFFVLITMCWLAFSAWAQTPSYIHASFVQSKQSVMLSEPIVQQGVFTYSAPDKVTWVYSDGIKAQLPAPILAFIRKAVAGELDGKKLPKQVLQLFTEVEVIKNPTTGVADKVILYEVNGDITTITFYDVETRP